MLGFGLGAAETAGAQGYSAGSGASAGGTDATAVGANATASGDRSMAGGANAAATGADAVAIGSSATAASATNDQNVYDLRLIPSADYPFPNEPLGTIAVRPSGTAIGQKSTVGTGGGVAIGYNNRAGVTPMSGNAYASTAIGTNNDASGAYAVGLGTANTASGISAISIGTANQAVGVASIAIGRQAYATGDTSLALGANATAGPNGSYLGYGYGSIAIGHSALAGINTGGTTLAIGDSAVATTASGAGDSMALGTQSAATGQDAMAIGAQTTASGVNTIAIGNNGTSAAGMNGVVVGVGSTIGSGVAGATVIGTGASAGQTGGVALGFGSTALRGGLSGAAESFSGAVVTSAFGAVSIGGAGAERQITNLAGGTADTDAVNLRQLRAVGNGLAGALGGGAGYTAGGVFVAPSYGYGGAAYGSVSDLATAIDAYGLRYDRDGGGQRVASIDLTRAGTVGPAVSLTGLAPATTAGGAVALSQMPLRYATQANPTTANPGTPSNDATLVGANATLPVALHNVANGRADTDAATLGQLRLTAAALGGGAGFDPVSGAFIAPGYTVAGRSYADVGAALAAGNALAVQYASDPAGTPTSVVDLTRGGTLAAASVRGVADGRIAAGSTDAVNGDQLSRTRDGLAQTDRTVAALQSGAAGLVRQDPATRGITVGADSDGNAVDLHNRDGAARMVLGVASGRIAAGSTEAVNGGQVYAATASIADALGGGAQVASDGALLAPRYAIRGTTYTTVGGALSGLDAAVANLDTTGSRYVAARSSGPAAQAVGADAVAIGSGAVASADRGVALGANAVAGRAGLNGAREAFSGTRVASTQGAVSIGDLGTERQIVNLAGGTQDTDAVNLRQLRAVGGNLAGALGGGAAFGSDGAFTAPSYAIGGQRYASVGAALGAVDAFGVKYDVDPATGGRGQTITLAGGIPTSPCCCATSRPAYASPTPPTPVRSQGPRRRPTPTPTEAWRPPRRRAPPTPTPPSRACSDRRTPSAASSPSSASNSIRCARRLGAAPRSGLRRARCASTTGRERSASRRAAVPGAARPPPPSASATRCRTVPAA